MVKPGLGGLAVLKHELELSQNHVQNNPGLSAPPQQSSLPLEVPLLSGPIQHRI